MFSLLRLVKITPEPPGPVQEGKCEKWARNIKPATWKNCQKLWGKIHLSMLSRLRLVKITPNASRPVQERKFERRTRNLMSATWKKSPRAKMSFEQKIYLGMLSWPRLVKITFVRAGPEVKFQNKGHKFKSIDEKKATC